ncbi:MAG: DUF5916 domain-containing protein [Gammaproteobacteria bacterium]|nr:hypothetical protein [Pseudomonadales bacterium]MCP5346979.1 hypothetical protein [Pseudomonadales bacterium]
MLKVRIPACVLLCLSCLSLPPAASGQPATPEAFESNGGVIIQDRRGNPIRLLYVDQDEADISVDGVIDEAVWSRVQVIDDMRVIIPDTLATVPYATATRIFYSRRGLYLSFDMEQPLDTLVQRISTRDNLPLNRDRIGVTLDTSGQGLFGYWMMLALGDNQLDGTILPERQYSNEWDGAWYGATQVTDHGWSAEFFIPWGQMAMPQEDEARHIGVYTERQVAHLDQAWAWPPIPRSEAIFMSNLPLLELEGIDPRQQWSIFPYLSTTFDQVDNSSNTEAGFDVFWRPSSNFQMTATANPDFGSVESDNVVVNLTAVEVFFPDKRLFFQEGQEIFNTTPRSTGRNGKRLAIVNTRRIGARPRSPDLPPGVRLPTRERIRPADLLGALKMTGQAGAVRYGVLAASEDDSEFKVDGQRFYQSGRDFTTFRMIYEDSQNAAYRGLGYIGSLVTHPESDAAVHAVDFHYLTIDGQFRVDGQAIASDSDDHGSGQGLFADFVYTPRQGLQHTLQMTYLDDKLDVNDFGYQERNDSRELWYRFQWIKSNLGWARNFSFNPFLRYEENSKGDRTNNAFPVLNMDITLNNLDRLNLSLMHFPKRYDDLNSFGNGTYAVSPRTNYGIGYSTNTALPVSYSAGFNSSGEFAGGTNLQYDAGITWQPVSNINLSGEIIYNDRDGWLIHQENQNFTGFQADQLRVNVNFDYFLSAKQQFRMVLQWAGIEAIEDEFFYLPSDAPTRNRDLIKVPKPAGPTDSFSLSQLNFQLRYRWQIAPLSDLFVVYTKGDNHRGILDEFGNLFQNSWDDPLGDQLVVKLRYRFGT